MNEKYLRGIFLQNKSSIISINSIGKFIAVLGEIILFLCYKKNMIYPMKKFLFILTLTFTLVALISGCSNNKHDESLISVVKRLQKEKIDYSFTSEMVDTIKIVDGLALGYVANGDIPPFLVYGKDVLITDPTLKIDSIDPNLFQFNLFGRRMVADFSNYQWIEEAKLLDQPLEGFKRDQRNYYLELGDSINAPHFSFTIDEPNVQKTRMWLKKVFLEAMKEYDIFTTEELDKDQDGLMDSIVLANKGFVELGKLMAAYYCNNMSTLLLNKNAKDVWFNIDIRARFANDELISYSESISEYSGGAHGMYSNRLLSFDNKRGIPIDNDYIFSEGSTIAVTDIIVQTIFDDPKFKEWNPKIKFDDLRKSFDRGGEMSIPQGAMMRRGVVFYFQPYELGPYAAGNFHYQIPYDTLLPYMTPRAIELMNSITE